MARNVDNKGKKSKTIFPEKQQNKVKLAKQIVPYITTENAWKVLDLQKNIKDLAVCIRKWNKMS